MPEPIYIDSKYCEGPIQRKKTNRLGELRAKIHHAGRFKHYKVTKEELAEWKKMLKETGSK